MPLVLGLSLLAMLGGCAMVESDVSSRSAIALSEAGVAGVAVDARYRDVTLRGPESARAAALAAVGPLDATKGVRYEATNDAAAPSASARVDAQVTFDGTGVVLRGVVASEAQRAELVAAAEKAVGAGSVTDELTVGTAASTVELDGAVTALAGYLPTLLPGVRSAELSLAQTDLSVTARAGTAAAATAAESAAQALTGVTVTSKFEAPVAPARRAADLEAQLRAVAKRSSINFATGSAAFLPGATAVLDRVAELIAPAARQVPSLRVEIQGHTDSLGAAVANQALSERRARAVLEYLVGRGVARGRLSAVGYGETRPVGDNTAEAGRLANRRIDFDVRS